METHDLFEKIKIPTHTDERGSLTSLDRIDELVEWPVKRSYWVTNTRLPRGGHCVKGERKFYIMAQGSCKARIYDGTNWYEFNLEGPGEALQLKADLWREFSDFSEGAVMFTLSSLHYDKSKYIMDIGEFEKYIKSLNK